MCVYRNYYIVIDSLSYQSANYRGSPPTECNPPNFKKEA